MVPQSAVVVWPVRGLVEDVHCYFFRWSTGFRLVVERGGERLMEETYEDLRELARRAGELRSNLLNVGFAPLEPGAAGARPGLGNLLREFAREGTAALHAGPAA
jgi:hypothetical protein